MHIPLAFAHKPVITTLKPVEEAEGPYMKMDGGMTEDWTHSEASPKQVLSPMQEDSCQTNGPPGKSYRRSDSAAWYSTIHGMFHTYYMAGGLIANYR